MISYIIETLYLPLVLGADYSGKFIWKVDASFAVHPDCRSHTVASMTLRHSSLVSLSLKQKINTKISTEAELIAVDYSMRFIKWINLFLESK